MNIISDKSLELNSLIKQSIEYRNYVNARNAIRSNEQLFNSLMEFKQRYTDIMQYTEGNPYDELYRIYHENDDLIHNSTVNEYLRAESAFSKLIRQVIADVSKDISIDT
ncbi:Cell fate regulator YlbF, YheA/YmcA/DUF963 family (controls sporulation, competence, biofilm development) [Lachnospiraceae bacterium]|nr:Cell fate regulator YlbF, YheA/YmcA/DUF963 family (controls sporulation, competence, biofilm development) [Lachnospiraceae bacterium]